MLADAVVFAALFLVAFAFSTFASSIEKSSEVWNVDSCVEDPSQSECRDYQYPRENSTADMAGLCKSMPYMPGCSVWNLCKDPQGRHADSKYCSGLSLLANICVKDMPGMRGCRNYRSLCNATTSQVKQCREESPIAGIPSTRIAKEAVVNICTSHEMDACAKCPLDHMGDCDILGTYAKLCIDMPEMPDCSGWRRMCDSGLSSDGNGWPELCLPARRAPEPAPAPPAPAPSPPAPPAPAPSPPVPSPEPLSCVEDPSQIECRDYQYPRENSTADMAGLCKSMPYMPGCSVWNLCKDPQGRHSDSKYCSGLSLLANICVKDMPGMRDCKRYRSLCNSTTSQVKQCREDLHIPNIPSTKQAKTAITNICTSHAMEACEQCPLDRMGECDMLGTYSQLCKAMPEMPDCEVWNDMCVSGLLVDTDGKNAGWPEYCRTPESSKYDPPIMRMYFHTGLSDYVLFYEWVPRDELQYWFSVLAIILMGVFFEFLQTYKSLKEHQWAERKFAGSQMLCHGSSDISPSTASINEETTASEGSNLLRKAEMPLEDIERQQRDGVMAQLGFMSWFLPLNSAPEPFSFPVELFRAAICFVETAIAYFLMLIAMTFNVGLFIAVLFGISLGTFLFARYRPTTSRRTCC